MFVFIVTFLSIGAWFSLGVALVKFVHKLVKRSDSKSYLAPLVLGVFLFVLQLFVFSNPSFLEGLSAELMDERKDKLLRQEAFNEDFTHCTVRLGGKYDIENNIDYCYTADSRIPFNAL